MTYDKAGLSILEDALDRVFCGFDGLPVWRREIDWKAVDRVVQETAQRLQGNYPFHHPLYIGQMLKPPHPIARLAYAMAIWQNPNNHALDGGPVSSEMEREAVAQIAEMLGWSSHLGHLCGGGTVANMEALWVARELHPDTVVVASSQAHYTHSRVCSVLGQDFEEIAVEPAGRMDLESLEAKVSSGRVGTVVATLGTTALGAVDPLAEIVQLRDKYGFRLHVDAAYGGYFRLVENLNEQAHRSLAAIVAADSIVIDPHKHGLQPYGCGCVLFRDPRVASIYGHDSPYTYFTADELHLGEISLECSRAGASAIALWATMKLLPLVCGGEFSKMLERCRDGALQLHSWLDSHPRFIPLLRPDLDIVVWSVAATSATKASQLAKDLFKSAASHDLHLALAKFPRKMLEHVLPVEHWDAEEVTCLRACVMKPEHHEWMPEITSRLEDAAKSVL